MFTNKTTVSPYRSAGRAAQRVRHGTAIGPRGAPVETVWKTINDPEVLRQRTPGLKERKETGPDTYQATLAIGIAAVRPSPPLW